MSDRSMSKIEVLLEIAKGQGPVFEALRDWI
jgi:hypothetical protein